MDHNVHVLVIFVGEKNKHAFLNAVNILKLTLLIPILVEQRVEALQPLRDFSNQVQILFSLHPRYVVFVVDQVQHFDPENFLPLGIGNHELQIEAPYENDGEDANEGQEQEFGINSNLERIVIADSQFQLLLIEKR